MRRIVADLGNTRLKWAPLDPTGQPGHIIAVASDDPSAWANAWSASAVGPPLATEWAVASVNPPMAARLAAFLADRAVSRVAWYRSAADVPVRHQLPEPGSTGVDRALAVAAALAAHGGQGPGLVVLCGTAITVERIDADGQWQGGAIAAGLALTSRALHAGTAQLPLVSPTNAPAAWGTSTRPALAAGIHWGVVGAIRELLTRQAVGLAPTPWIVWSGGDAHLLAAGVDDPRGLVIDNLVLRGLANLTFAAAHDSQDKIRRTHDDI